MGMDPGCWLGPRCRDAATGQMMQEEITPLFPHLPGRHRVGAEARKRLCPIAALFPHPLNQGEAFEGKGQSVGGRLCPLATAGVGVTATAGQSSSDT